MLMRYLLLILFCYGLAYSQNYLPKDSPLIGKWELISPKNSPGPEFIMETYIGIGVFELVDGAGISMAAARFDNTEGKFINAAEFIAEWDGTRLTGLVSVNNWPKLSDPLKIGVPMVYDAKKDRIIIHINNVEYGDVKFIYKRAKP
jgi:hypothetical protein